MALLHPRLPTADTRLILWGRLYGAAAALSVAEAAAAAPGPLVVLAPNAREAESLSDAVGFFLGKTCPVRVFPDLETLPYDSFSAHPTITSARLKTLAELPRLKSGVLIVAIDTLLQRLPPRSYIDGYSLQVRTGEALDLDALRAQLAAAGYAAVTRFASTCWIATSTASGVSTRRRSARGSGSSASPFCLPAKLR